jgi:hypothetical protein
MGRVSALLVVLLGITFSYPTWQELKTYRKILHFLKYHKTKKKRGQEKGAGG